MKKYLFAILLSLLSLTGLHAENKLILLISTPRSLSTGFLRMMEAHGDFRVFNQPATMAYHISQGKDIIEHYQIDNENLPKTFQEVKDMLFAQLDTQSVFAKEMSYAVDDFMHENIDMLKDPRVHVIFLTRDPASIAISLYQKGGPEIFKYIEARTMGIDIMNASYELVSEKGANPPLLILSEDLAADPEGTARKICKHVGIPYRENMLSWSPYESVEEAARTWKDMKDLESFEIWHKDAAKSSGFRPLRAYAKDEAGKPTFEEIDAEFRNEIQPSYKNSLKHYNRLLKLGKKTS